MVDKTNDKINFPTNGGSKSGYNDEKQKQTLHFLLIKADSELEQAEILNAEARGHNSMVRDLLGRISHFLEGGIDVREFCKPGPGPNATGQNGSV